MKRKVQLVLVCEDQQHSAFARRFLEETGWPARKMRVESRNRRGTGGHSFVTAQYPKELKALRSDHVHRALVVLVDGDAMGVGARVEALRGACEQQGIDPRKQGEHVMFAIPTRNIETWLEYLRGREVNEVEGGYTGGIKRARECGPHAKALAEMCARGQLREPAPESLKAACVEYQTRLAPLG